MTDEPTQHEQVEQLAGLLSTQFPLNERHPEDAVPLAHFLITSPDVAKLLLDQRIEYIGIMVAALYRLSQRTPQEILEDAFTNEAILDMMYASLNDYEQAHKQSAATDI